MKQYSRYKFSSGAKLVKGQLPNFFDLLIKNIDKSMLVLDLGCGSGELTLQVSKYCRKIVGLDTFSKYINTANTDKKKKEIANVIFKKGNAKKIAFKKEAFDLIYSSRGPLSADNDFMKEAGRVLKKGGLLIEETIGETDKLELKKVFGRGQNYPYTFNKEVLVKRLLDKQGIELIYKKNFKYYQEFSSLAAVARMLERTPIISDFNRRLDSESLKKLKKLNKGGKIILSAHRLWWVGRK